MASSVCWKNVPEPRRDGASDVFPLDTGVRNRLTGQAGLAAGLNDSSLRCLF